MHKTNQTICSCWFIVSSSYTFHKRGGRWIIVALTPELFFSCSREYLIQVLRFVKSFLFPRKLLKVFTKCLVFVTILSHSQWTDWDVPMQLPARSMVNCGWPIRWNWEAKKSLWKRKTNSLTRSGIRQSQLWHGIDWYYLTVHLASLIYPSGRVLFFVLLPHNINGADISKINIMMPKSNAVSCNVNKVESKCKNC